MFTLLIETLIKSGMTEKQVAQRVGASQPTINRIRRGRQKPGYELADALRELARTRSTDGPHTTAEEVPTPGDGYRPVGVQDAPPPCDEAGREGVA
jgi:transcriptional regulator with XRE-family HTH domain